jgi:5-methylcytosine-specific restriction endonuclease McrA
MKWKEFIHHQVVAHCNATGLRTFTLKEFITEVRLHACKAHFPNNQHPTDKIRQQLQLLRNQGTLYFHSEARGTYTLVEEDALETEVDSIYQPIIRETKELVKKEYLRETFARDQGWVRMAKDVLGTQCLCPSCSNTFQKPDDTPYIEVHHIKSLSEGGEDALWNLSTLCAHHHRMAHFAKDEVRHSLNTALLSITDSILKQKKLA